MSELLTIIIITIVILSGSSIYFHIKKSVLQFIIPMIGLVIGLALIGISFIIGSWEGLGMGAFGFSVFIGSAIAFLLTAIISSARDLKKNIR